MNNNLYALLQHGFTLAEDRVFLHVPDGGVWTYQDMDRLCGRFARAFLDMGVSAGDRIVVQVEKSAAAIAVYLACLRIGAVYTPLNTSYRLREVEFFLTDASPALFICTPENHEQYQPLSRQAGIRQQHALGTNDSGYLWSMVRDLDSYTDIAEVAASDVAAMLYTSGTTGRPKGALLSHGNLCANAVTLHHYWGFGSSDVLLHALPVYHVHGLFVALHCAMLSACRVLFLPAFNVDQILTCLPRATVMMGVPTYYTRLLAREEFNAALCSNIRVFISGSAPLLPQTFETFQQRTGQRILERYGMTETGMIASNPLQGERIAGTVGFPLPGIELRITGDKGQILADGEIGNVEVRGPNVFHGYWKRPEVGAEVFREDGFFITGDLGLLDDGRLTLAGRGKDLIISGGLNIYPREIEMCLDDLPGIRESAVIGVPHPDFGEAVVAVVVAETGAVLVEERIIDGIKSDLAGFKQPKCVFSVDELPRNAMGKVEKNVLRERYWDVFEV
jgi:malonyl-CoA/methylmalonyl-CoA synthetase